MNYRCYVWGKDSDWEAICTDLDIAVQGRSFDDTKSLLNEAITNFLTDVESLPTDDRQRLLNRRSPLLLRMKLRLKYLLFIVRRLIQEIIRVKQQGNLFSTSVYGSNT